MTNIINVVSEDNWLSSFKDSSDMRAYIKECGCDKVEYIRCPPDTTGIITKDMVEGAHLAFYPNWVDFYHQNEDYLYRHFGSKEVWEGYYMCKTPEDYIKYIEADMAYAQSMGVKYAVFHVSDVSNEEMFTYNWEHSNTEVIKTTAELLNTVMKGKEYSFTLLLENLFTPGMDFTNPKETELMLSLVDYENKGIMLDTGHLMSTNLDITTEAEGFKYVMSKVREHGELAKYIKGCHLHKSVSGEYTKAMLKKNIVPKKDFYECFAQSYDVVLHIDRHENATAKEARELIDLVSPEYLVHELSAKTRETKKEAVRTQLATLGMLR